MMASNAGDTGEPTKPMSTAETDELWSEWGPKFTRNGISRGQTEAFTNEDGSRITMEGSNERIKCKLAMAFKGTNKRPSGSGMSCSSSSSTGSFNAATYSSADGSQNNEAEYKQAILLQQKIRDKLSKMFQPNFPFGRNWF